MKTKRIILLAAMSSLMVVTTLAEIKTVFVDSNNREATIEIKDGEVGKCLYGNFLIQGRNEEYARLSGSLSVVIGSSKINIIPHLHSPRTHPVASLPLPIISGPAIIKLGYSMHNIVLAVEITPNETATSKAAGPALVLPEGEDGKQKLVLESSTDLVNWTEDSLGSKDSSDKKRFYRLRAVKE
jgi:hypothetical protein